MMKLVKSLNLPASVWLLCALALALNAGAVETVVEVGTTFTDPGASAFDTYDGDLTPSLTVSGTVNASVVGVYNLTYDVVDSSGNHAEPFVRTVRVVDTTAPVITVLGESRVTVDLGVSYSDAGATADDNYDGNLTSAIVVSGLPVDTSKEGIVTVRYNVQDSNGNCAVEKTRTVEVKDPFAPSPLSLVSPAPDSTIYVGQNLASIPLVLQSTCSVAVDSVEYTVDGVPFGMSGDAPFTAITDLSLSSFGLGVHTVTATGQVTGSSETVIASATFALASTPAAHDTDANGIPDNPFAALTTAGDMWFSSVSIPAAAAPRTVGLVRFDSSVPDVPVQFMLENPAAASRSVSAGVPRGLVADGEAGMFIVAASDDLTALYGLEGVSAVTPEPANWALVQGGQYVHLSVIRSADNGASFLEVDPAKLAASPVHVDIAGLVFSAGKQNQLYAHAAYVDSFDATGIQLLGDTGSWGSTGLANASTTASGGSFDLTALSVAAPYEQQTLPVSVTTASLPQGRVYTTYKQTLAASGGAPAYTWAKTSGSLPNGLSLSTAGVISGKPTRTGTYTFTVEVTDAQGQTATKSLSIYVKGLFW